MDRKLFLQSLNETKKEYAKIRKDRRNTPNEFKWLHEGIDSLQPLLEKKGGSTEMEQRVAKRKKELEAKSGGPIKQEAPTAMGPTTTTNVEVSTKDSTLDPQTGKDLDSFDPRDFEHNMKVATRAANRFNDMVKSGQMTTQQANKANKELSDRMKSFAADEEQRQKWSAVEDTIDTALHAAETGLAFVPGVGTVASAALGGLHALSYGARAGLYGNDDKNYASQALWTAGGAAVPFAIAKAGGAVRAAGQAAKAVREAPVAGAVGKAIDVAAPALQNIEKAAPGVAKGIEVTTQLLGKPFKYVNPVGAAAGLVAGMKATEGQNLSVVDRAGLVTASTIGGGLLMTAANKIPGLNKQLPTSFNIPSLPLGAAKASGVGARSAGTQPSQPSSSSKPNYVDVEAPKDIPGSWSPELKPKHVVVDTGNFPEIGYPKAKPSVGPNDYAYFSAEPISPGTVTNVAPPGTPGVKTPGLVRKAGGYEMEDISGWRPGSVEPELEYKPEFGPSEPAMPAQSRTRQPSNVGKRASELVMAALATNPGGVPISAIPETPTAIVASPVIETPPSLPGTRAPVGKPSAPTASSQKTSVPAASDASVPAASATPTAKSSVPSIPSIPSSTSSNQQIVQTTQYANQGGNQNQQNQNQQQNQQQNKNSNQQTPPQTPPKNPVPPLRRGREEANQEDLKNQRLDILDVLKSRLGEFEPGEIGKDTRSVHKNRGEEGDGDLTGRFHQHSFFRIPQSIATLSRRSAADQSAGLPGL